MDESPCKESEDLFIDRRDIERVKEQRDMKTQKSTKRIERFSPLFPIPEPKGELVK